ncbi:MAG: leucyl aminopeptidase [Nocardioidaceae bacterium]|nr:leucyl aminopeptidase [Nocardioidaceae bacterium]
MQRHGRGPTVCEVSRLKQPRPPLVDIVQGGLTGSGAAVLAVGFTGTADAGAGRDYTLGAGSEAALAEVGLDAFELLQRAQAKGSAGEVLTREVLDANPLRLLLLVGLGGDSAREYRRAGAAIARSARGRGTCATSIGSLADDEQLGAFVEGLVLGGFGFVRRSVPDDTSSVAGDEPLRILLTDVPPGDRDAVVGAAVARAGASWRSRTYALTPSNEKGPVQLQRWAEEAADRARLSLDVWDDKRLQADGFGGIVAVGSGSAYESRFLRLDYEPRRASRRTPHVVIVGKGITFDSGGISIKPRDAMMTMKRDMTGAGVVIAVMGALRELDVQVLVSGLVASAENAFGAASMRPGDIVTHYGGRTSEIGNTDAEGRLVLADALAYADRHIDAAAVVDVATLTGAGKVALGTSLGAVFANDDALATALVAAGEVAGEPLWRLPLCEEYESLLDNPFADATNAAGGPGAITAALFLQHFAGSAPWAHLDIASVGDAPNDAFEYTKGATGFGARLLLRWLGSYA